MALRIANIGAAQDISTPGVGDIYTSTGTRSLIKNITICNTTGGAALVNLWILRGATAVRITTMDLSVPSKGVVYFDSVYTLESGDKLQADSTVAGVSIIASGAVEV